MIQLVDAILSCNRHGIAHRDIKLSNITFPIPVIQRQGDIKKNSSNNYNKNERERSREKGKKTETAIPGMKKSLSATFLPFQDNLRNSCHENKETDDHESDFNFDYCDNESDENGNSDHHEHEKNIVEMGIEIGKEAERERDNKILENEEREELKHKDEDIFIKLADFGMAGFIGRDGRLRGRCGTPGKMKTKKAILLTVLIIRYIIM